MAAENGGEEKTYWYLAIVLAEDINNGSFYPSYILCRSRVTSNKRTGLRVIKNTEDQVYSIPKLLVTETTGHEDLLDFLSIYQTQDHARGTHYHPVGALCWFSCNAYGDATGTVVYARAVPIKSLMWNFYAKREFRMRHFDKTLTLQDLFSREPVSEPYPYMEIKPVLSQSPNRAIQLKGKKIYGKRKNN